MDASEHGANGDEKGQTRGRKHAAFIRASPARKGTKFAFASLLSFRANYIRYIALVHSLGRGFERGIWAIVLVTLGRIIEPRSRTISAAEVAAFVDATGDRSRAGCGAADDHRLGQHHRWSAADGY